MLFLAVKNLVQEKTRLLISIGGVAFSVLLIMSIQGLYQGWSNKIGEYIHTVPADYWITQAGATDMFHTPSVLPLTVRDFLTGVEGVASAKPFSGRRVAFPHNGKDINLYVIADDLENKVGAPARVVEGKTVPGEGEIIINRVVARSENIRIADTIPVAGRTLTVAGYSEAPGPHRPGGSAPGVTVVSVQDVSKTFGAGHTAVTAVDHVSLEVEGGDILLVMGPSGSGKTILLSMIGTPISPTTGRILISGQDTSTLAPAQLSGLLLREFGFVFQTFNLLSALTAEENVMLPLLTAGLHRRQARAKARAALEQLQLGHRLGNLPRDLSGGEKQRVAIARSLANDPHLILADEPTANLDARTGQDVTLLLCETACRENRAVIIVSHDQRLRTAEKRVITIEDGRLTTEENGEHNLNCSMHAGAGSS